MRGSHPICMRGGWRAAADSVMHREIIMFVGVSVFLPPRVPCEHIPCCECVCV